MSELLFKVETHKIMRTLNYLAASKLKVGLIVNFGKDFLEWKRLVL
ncbi:MAG: hypothetical protein HYY40_09630 [Bacteroidetes bacterium]|nr:hypothetical protein [Bacteroidota bacterium]